jgi:hypothetical protein
MAPPHSPGDASTARIKCFPNAFYDLRHWYDGCLQAGPSAAPALSFPASKKAAKKAAQRARKQAKQQQQQLGGMMDAAALEVHLFRAQRWAVMVFSFALRHSELRAALLEGWQLLDWLEVRTHANL